MIFNDLVEDFDYVITLSDHGEMFGEDGIWGHCHGVAPELTHVPLVVYGDEQEMETVERPVSLIDIYQTVLDLASVDVKDDRPSKFLFNDDHRAILTERYGFNKEALEGMNGEELDAINQYDRLLRGLVTTDMQYGYETISGIRSVDEITEKEAQMRIEAIVQTLSEWQHVDTSVNVSDGIKRQLKDLGYA